MNWPSTDLAREFLAAAKLLHAAGLIRDLERERIEADVAAALRRKRAQTPKRKRAKAK